MLGMMRLTATIGTAALRTAQRPRAMSAGRVVVGGKARVSRERKAVMSVTETAAARISALLESRHARNRPSRSRLQVRPS